MVLFPCESVSVAKYGRTRAVYAFRSCQNRPQREEFTNTLASWLTLALSCSAELLPSQQQHQQQREPSWKSGSSTSSCIVPSSGPFGALRSLSENCALTRERRSLSTQFSNGCRSRLHNTHTHTEKETFPLLILLLSILLVCRFSSFDTHRQINEIFPFSTTFFVVNLLDNL